MKFPVAWHKDSLKNSRAFWSEKLEQAIAIVKEYNVADAENVFYNTQINEAERRGLTEFDRDKFMVPRNKKKNEDKNREGYI